MAQRVRDSGSHAGWMPERVSASMHGMAAAQSGAQAESKPATLRSGKR